MLALRASEVTNYDQFNLSKETLEELEESFRKPETAIWEARKIYYDFLLIKPEKPKGNSPAMEEFITALNYNGYLRRDITPGSFRIGRLFRAVYGDELPTPIKICDFREIWYGWDTPACNRRYEEFENFKEKEEQAVISYLRRRLTFDECVVLDLRLGLTRKSGVPATVEEISKILGKSNSYVVEVERRAEERLRSNNVLAVVLREETTSGYLEALVAELNEIRKDPAFVREREKLDEIRELVMLPYSCSDLAKACLGRDENIDITDVDALGLCVATRNLVKNAGLHTLYDLIEADANTWQSIARLGIKGAREVASVIYDRTGFKTNIVHVVKAKYPYPC